MNRFKNICEMFSHVSISPNKNMHISLSFRSLETNAIARR